MIQKLKYIVCISLMLFVSGLSYALDDTQTDKDSCFLWEVRSKTATVYLMGSFHMLKRDMYPLDNCINGAFAKADTLVVEINMDAVDQDKMTAMFNERGRYRKGVTIEQRLSKETLKKLNDYLAQVGADITQVNTMKPWFLGMTIAVQEMMGLGYDPNLGVDMYFLANAEGKKVLELETLEQQLEILAGDPEDVQDMALRMALDDIPDLESLMNRMVSAWSKGDAEALDRIMREPSDRYPLLEHQFKRTIDDRNLEMADKIAKFLKTDQTYFVVVGSGHIGGQKGLLSLIRKMGYAVQQLPKAADSRRNPQNAKAADGAIALSR